MAFKVETENEPNIPHPLETEEFVWVKFREYFPFGDVSLRERRYQDIVTKALDGFKSARERELLLDMLDLQACVLIEQVWIQQEQTGNGKRRLFAAETHFSSSRLSLHSLLRLQYDLPSKTSGGTVLDDLPQEMTLFDLLGHARYGGRP